MSTLKLVTTIYPSPGQVLSAETLEDGTINIYTQDEPKEPKHRHVKGRPEKVLPGMLRLTDELEWVPDDGLPGLAFVALDSRFPMHWVASCPVDNDDCPSTIASHYNLKKHSCSNGRPLLLSKPEKE